MYQITTSKEKTYNSLVSYPTLGDSGSNFTLAPSFVEEDVRSTTLLALTGVGSGVTRSI